MTITTLDIEYTQADSWDDLTDEQQQVLIKDWLNMEQYGGWEPGADEVFDSIKAIVKAADCTLTDWSIGAYNRHNYITVSGDDDRLDLEGPRALAWLENVVLGPLRVPWQGKRRREVAKYGWPYRPGLVPPCPLTWVYCDESLLDALKGSLRSGMTVRDSLQSLADTAGRLLEDEWEAYHSEDYAREVLANEGGTYRWPTEHPLVIDRV